MKWKIQLKEMLEERRKKKFLHGILKDMKGLEIGPSFHPLAPKSEGYKVETIDHLSREELMMKYKDIENVDVSRIEEVDYIWEGQHYCELTGKEGYYDYILASHLIEHTTDFVGFFQDCSVMLKDNGVLSLAVPDKRYCFDHFRTVTDIQKVLDDHLAPRELGSIGELADYCLNTVNRRGKIAWNRVNGCFGRNAYRNIHTLEVAGKMISETISKPVYHDIHRYVFTLSSFRLLINDLNALGYIDLYISQFFHDIKGSEFIVLLKKSDKRCYLGEKDRRKLQRKASRENVMR